MKVHMPGKLFTVEIVNLNCKEMLKHLVRKERPARKNYHSGGLRHN